MIFPHLSWILCAHGVLNVGIFASKEKFHIFDGVDLSVSLWSGKQVG